MRLTTRTVCASWTALNLLPELELALEALNEVAATHAPNLAELEHVSASLALEIDTLRDASVTLQRLNGNPAMGPIVDDLVSQIVQHSKRSRTLIRLAVDAIHRSERPVQIALLKAQRQLRSRQPAPWD